MPGAIEEVDPGGIEAVTRVGFRHSEGKGVPRDYAQALQGYRKAAKKGYARAQHNRAVVMAREQ